MNDIFPTTASKIKALALTGWTVFILAFTLAWFFALASIPADPGQTIDQHHAAVGGAAVMIAGCTGGGWLCGLLVIVLIAAVLRP